MTEVRRHERPRELAYRLNDRVEVTLLWHPADDELRVCVCDHRLGAYFEVVPASEDALDAFYHPYAYASAIDVHYEDARLAA
jgi:hypothetical protein